MSDTSLLENFHFSDFYSFFDTKIKIKENNFFLNVDFFAKFLNFGKTACQMTANGIKNRNLFQFFVSDNLHVLNRVNRLI